MTLPGQDVELRCPDIPMSGRADSRTSNCLDRRRMPGQVVARTGLCLDRLLPGQVTILTGPTVLEKPLLPRPLQAATWTGRCPDMPRPGRPAPPARVAARTGGSPDRRLPGQAAARTGRCPERPLPGQALPGQAAARTARCLERPLPGQVVSRTDRGKNKKRPQ
jgi:hypothetical protein